MMQFPHQKYPDRLWKCIVWQVLTLKLSQLILREPVLKLRLLGFPLEKFSKGVTTFQRLFRKRIPMEDVKFKATVSQGLKERLLQQCHSVLRQMKRQTIIRSGGDFMTWNLELQLGFLAPAEWFGVMKKIEAKDLPPHPLVL